MSSIRNGSSFRRRRSVDSVTGLVTRPVVTPVPRLGPSRSNVATAEVIFLILFSTYIYDETRTHMH